MTRDLSDKLLILNGSAYASGAKMKLFQHSVLMGVIVLSAGNITFLAGCGGGSDEKPKADTGKQTPAAEQSNKSKEATTSGQTASTDSNRQRGQDEIWTDGDGNKYIGKVPYDAFYDQPYSVASNLAPLNGATPTVAPDTGTTGGAGMGAGTTQTPPETTTTEPETTTAASGGSWEEMMPEEVLSNEIKEVRNFLNGTLQSVGSYNSSMLMIEPKVASIGLLAQISMDHPAELTWKEDAPYIRNLAKKMVETPLQRGKKDQARLLKLFENMTDTFNRSRPADLEEPPAEDSFSDATEMRFVMKRMEEAEQRLKQEAGTESAFTAQKEMVKHEAAILETFTHIIGLEEYGYADGDEFDGYVNTVKTAAQEIRNSVDAGNFDGFEAALSKISSSCVQCHTAFKE